MNAPALPDFVDHVGDVHPVETDDGATSLEPASAVASPLSPQGFTLEFAGPGAPVLPQATHRFGRDDLAADFTPGGGDFMF